MNFQRMARQRLVQLSTTPRMTMRTSRSIRIQQRSIVPVSRGYATKKAPGKDDIDTTSTEYSKSGGDQQAAQSGEAFDPNTTRPETETSGEDNASGGASSLNASPGNPEVNQTKEEEVSASGKSAGEAGDSSSDRAATSQRGSPKKDGQ